ncbi:MAG: hypothetical protein FJ104_09800, partial [Deltaproteobacteria bacterium]|nr:hypothetical protein [Deltaproteobacteria bacterium]
AEARRGSVRRRALLHTSEAYTFTAVAAAEVVRRLLDRPVPSGFWTPAGLFGADFVLDLGARREDLT